MLDHERAVRARYAAAAVRSEPALCCPTSYDPKFLRILPEEIIAKDYGCGDPSQFVNPGETAVDLGSGAGKICYILSQKVGPAGRVIGVDMNDDMLTLARKYQPEMARRIGHDNVSFRKARIQDMALDLDQLATWLQANPVRDLAGLAALEEQSARLRQRAPAVADGQADVVVSNCVLNLVRPTDKAQLFADIFRILKRGGRAVISDIVCDEEPTAAIKNDPDLWSGCIAGAFREDEFLRAFERAGFYGVEIVERAAEPWQVVDGIEFRSVTVRSFRGKDGPCLERNQAVLYQGPWRAVEDDDGHKLRRGERMAVCDKTFQNLTAAHGPYAGHCVPVPPRVLVPLAEAGPFRCQGMAVRDPRTTKGEEYRESKLIAGEDCCDDTTCC
ncbi:MAG: methyltransferase domain-containing protein [Planctomycetota bacterium]